MSESEKVELKRIDRILSNLGYGSRKEVTKMARQERIEVAGVVVKDASAKADPHQITLDGEPLDHPDDLLIMLNKPRGYVCSHDLKETPRAFDLLPAQWMERNPQPMAIGRLDKETTGLILITTISQLVHQLTSPKNVIEKVYEVEVDGPLDEKLIGVFASGKLMLADDPEPCLPARLELLGPTSARVTLTEGRYHQVRRMFGSQGYLVVKLHRTQFGPYTLGDLPSGQFMEVPLP
jgi:16S rRNA pseudouridine516 synthase